MQPEKLGPTWLLWCTLKIFIKSRASTRNTQIEKSIYTIITFDCTRPKRPSVSPESPPVPSSSKIRSLSTQNTYFQCANHWSPLHHFQLNMSLPLQSVLTPFGNMSQTLSQFWLVSWINSLGSTFSRTLMVFSFSQYSGAAMACWVVGVTMWSRITTNL